MKLLFSIFVIFIALNVAKSEKRFQKMYECKSNEEFVIIERCDVTDGKFCLVTNTIKAINGAYVSIISQKMELYS